MDLFNPADRRPVHFMGVGGAGMSALAVLACRRGVVVTGCDTDLAGAQDVIASGAQVMLGHDPSHVTGTRAVVVTAAVPDTHPELEQARAAGIPVVPRKEALGGLVNGMTVVGAAGTHGKTTTTVMTTAALEAAGLQPTGLAGGRVREWGGNARLGGSTLYVVEADEYDKAFLALEPTVAIVNNVEPDHLECYGSIDQLEAAFAEFASRADTVLIGADDAGARRVARSLGNRVWRFGTAADAELRIGAVAQDAAGSRSEVTLPDGRRVTLALSVPGMHNVRNAAGALGAVAALDGSVERALEALAAFSGVGRRFDRLGEAGGVVLVDDYAHHPSELVATLAAARQAYPERRLVAVFQPHLYSRTQEHGAAMGQALAAADVVVVADVYGAREAPVAGVTGQLVADAAREAGADVTFEPDRPALAHQVRARLRPGDLVLTLGAGDITRIGPELLSALAPA
ncbi:MAG TPA: UDP-N-acetylmuramate--L-alanine ligase [Gemmatimonadales bacterium]|jgi:UDP-N-acetylmuramate--alanine ligase|nr:UDP-N-acetylmuramate--L-alanine ligase [Gemmatimonadales bacterium]